jgi:hypothetical protein
MAMLARCAKQLKCGDGWNGRYGGEGLLFVGARSNLDFGFKEVE